MKRKLLIIEDESSLAKQLKWALTADYAVTIATSAKQARSLVGSCPFPVITLDLGLPPFPDSAEEGLRLLEDIRAASPFSKVVVLTGNSEEAVAIRAVSLGASDFCAKPLDLELLRIILSRTYRLHELEEANRNLEKQCCAAGGLCGMLGVSPPMVSLFGLIRQVSTTDYPVLVTGESGTGKEMAAHAIHSLSRRARDPLVIINCGAIPENLLESELFGHEKGSFTGAVARKLGRFEQAQGGTVFLDEIGEMPLALQVKILRFLQEGTIERVGGIGPIKLDVRVIAATNVDLAEAVEAGSFRKDLFHRLNVVPVTMPPLRDRPEDVVLLAQHFLREELRVSGRRPSTFSPAAMASLADCDWQGNVRELQNRIRRAVTLTDGVIQPEHLGLGESKVSVDPEPRVITLQEARSQAEIKVIREALTLSGGNISQAARLLDVTRPTLHDLMKRHGVS